MGFKAPNRTINVLSGARLAVFERVIHVEPPGWRLKGGTIWTYKTLEEAKSIEKLDFGIGSKSSYSVRQSRRSIPYVVTCSTLFPFEAFTPKIFQ